jgi:hypothetical protein
MKKSYIAVTLAGIGIVFAGITASAATQVGSTFTLGIHTYELWDAPGISWAAAETAAEAEGGYLATFTTAGETAAVNAAFLGQGFFQPVDTQAASAWLGAVTLNGSGNANQQPLNWKWVTGEAWNAYDAGNFASGEPNGDSEGLTINRFGNSSPGKWNDEGSYVGGYIVEHGSVPDGGSSLALLGGAFALVGALGRKFRK